MTQVPENFPATYARFLRPIHAKCRRLLVQTQDAEDAAHETFLRFWQSDLRLDDGHDARTITAWLYRTCTHVAIDVLRRRRDSIDEEMNLPCGLKFENAVAARSLIAAVVRHLPDDELEVAVLCRVDGLTDNINAGAICSSTPACIAAPASQRVTMVGASLYRALDKNNAAATTPNIATYAAGIAYEILISPGITSYKPSLGRPKSFAHRMDTTHGR